MIGCLCESVTSGQKKSGELTNAIIADEASEGSEFLSALTASVERFIHKTLKDEQVECIRRIACKGRDVFWPCYRWDSARVPSPVNSE